MWGQDWGTMIWGGSVSVPMLGPVGLAFLMGALLGAMAIAWRRQLSRAATTFAVLAITIAPLLAVAVTLPHAFTNGTVADADEVNANFDALAYRTIPRATGLGPGVGTDSGLIAARQLNLTKDRADTTLRIQYSDNLRALLNGGIAACRWEIRVDGATCPSGALIYDVVTSDSTSSGDHETRSTVGYCDGLAAGAHSLQVYVGTVPGFALTDCYTGMSSQRWVLEAEEVF